MSDWKAVGVGAAICCTFLILLIGADMAGCAAVRPVARTAVEAAKAACELFGEQAPPDVMGMSLDACMDRLLAVPRQGGRVECVSR